MTNEDVNEYFLLYYENTRRGKGIIKCFERGELRPIYDDDLNGVFSGFYINSIYRESTRTIQPPYVVVYTARIEYITDYYIQGEIFTTSNDNVLPLGHFKIKREAQKYLIKEKL